MPDPAIVTVRHDAGSSACNILDAMCLGLSRPNLGGSLPDPGGGQLGRPHADEAVAGGSSTSLVGGVASVKRPGGLPFGGRPPALDAVRVPVPFRAGRCVQEGSGR